MLYFEVDDICLCLKSLCDTEMKNSEIILLAKENRDSVMWILVLSLVKICNERSKLSKEKYLRSKMTPASRMVLNPLFKEINRLGN